jgi:hypothetical protein
MSYDYDVYDSSPANFGVHSTMAGAVAGPFWSPLRLSLNRTMVNQPGKKYCRIGSVPGDYNKYDTAKLIVGTQHGPGGAAIGGDIYVDYHVRLWTPGHPASGVDPSPKNASVFNLAADQVLTNGVPELVNVAETVFNVPGIVNNAGTYTIPKGVWNLAFNTCLHENAAENAIAAFELLKNGASFNPPVEMISDEEYLAGDDVVVALNDVFASDGTDTIALKVTPTFTTAGAFKLLADNTRLIFSLMS